MKVLDPACGSGNFLYVALQRLKDLDTAHRNPDVAVFAAYGWEPDMADDELLGRLLELNLARAANPEGIRDRADSPR